MKKILFFALITAGWIQGESVGQLGSNKVGKVFPNHVGIDVSRPGIELISPADLLQSSTAHVFIAFFQTTCAPCLVEIGQLNKERSLLRDKGVTVLLVGVQEEPADLRKFLKQRGWSFPVLADRYDGEYSHQCGVFSANEERKIPVGVLLHKGSKGDLILDAAWQGGESDIVQQILGKIR